MRFSPQCVVFAAIIENESSSPLFSNKFCSGCFWLMHFLYSEMPKITSFSHCISPRLPESATKVAISILRVNYTWDSAVHCHFTLPHSCTFTFWVPFWPNFHFFHIFRHQIGTFIAIKGFNFAFRASCRLSRALQLLFQNFPPHFPGFCEH